MSNCCSNFYPPVDTKLWIPLYPFSTSLTVSVKMQPMLGYCEQAIYYGSGSSESHMGYPWTSHRIWHHSRWFSLAHGAGYACTWTQYICMEQEYFHDNFSKAISCSRHFTAYLIFIKQTYINFHCQIFRATWTIIEWPVWGVQFLQISA